jgi:hypothetical protein
MYAFFSCFDFISIDVLLHVIQPENMAPLGVTSDQNRTIKHVRMVPETHMFETIKTLCSPAQNPDPQGHSGALGKHNFSYLMFVWKIYFFLGNEIKTWKESIHFDELRLNTIVYNNIEWKRTLIWTVNEHILNHKKNMLRNTKVRDVTFLQLVKQWLNIYFWITWDIDANFTL